MITITSLALVANLLIGTSAHTYLVKPKGRQAFKFGFGDELKDGTGNGEGLIHIGDGTATCGGNDRMSSSQMTTYKRGDPISLHFWRNNHVGGFSRVSIVPIEDSDSQDNFDANVRSYACAQVGCTETYGGDSPNNWNGGDARGNLGWSNLCTSEFKVPYDLDDGTYTFQWVWHGQGNAPSANSPFQTCVDFVVQGGPTGSKPKCPLWKGGDTSEKNANACVYVSVNNPTYQGICASANACQGQYEVGVPENLDQCYAGKSVSTYPLGMTALASGLPDTYSKYSPSGGSSSTNKKTTTTTSDEADPSSTSSKKTGSDTTRKPNTKTSVRKCSSKSKRSHSRRSPRFHAYEAMK